jgi:GNAT superfamily N-acetyltransferase
MALGTWWHGDTLPDLPVLPSFSIHATEDKQLLAKLNNVLPQEVNNRFQTGNHAYLTYIDEAIVAYGWVATQSAGVREISLSWTIPPQNRYLWDFQTRPEWRGRGIYPHFLQAILCAEMHRAERFWILYAPGNEAAEHSIRKAGFQFLGELVLTHGRVTGFTLFEKSERALAGAAFLQLPVVANEGR